MTKATASGDIIWGYIAQALNIGAGLILLPVILRYLSPEDVGLWFVFITLASLAQLLEFGFQPTLARNAAYVYAGASSLVSVGLPATTNPDASVDYSLLAQLVSVSRLIYRCVALGAAVVLLGGGTYYISTVLVPTQNVFNALMGWVAFGTGYIVTFYFGYFNAQLQGRGDITQANKVVTITRGSLVLIGATLVMCGYGLLGMGIASLASAIIGRIAASRFLFSSKRPETKKIFSAKCDGLHLIRTLLPNASRLAAVQIGAFLIQRTSVLLVSSQIGLAVAASYGMTMTVLMALSSMAIVPCQVQIPYMNTLQVGGQKDKLKTVYCSSVGIAWIVYILGVIFIVLGGDWLLQLISSKTMLISTDQVMLLAFVLFLELTHTIAATYLTTINIVPFVKAAILSGMAITGIGIVVAPHFGVWGLIVVQGTIQLAYNNWKWPYLAMRHLDLSPRSLLHSLVIETAHEVVRLLEDFVKLLTGLKDKGLSRTH